MQQGALLPGEGFGTQDRTPSGTPKPKIQRDPFSRGGFGTEDRNPLGNPNPKILRDPFYRVGFGTEDRNPSGDPKPKNQQSSECNKLRSTPWLLVDSVVKVHRGLVEQVVRNVGCAAHTCCVVSWVNMTDSMGHPSNNPNP